VSTILQRLVAIGANIRIYSLVACGIYYFVWINLLPKLNNYQIRQVVVELDDGAVTHKLIKVPNEDVAKWDSEHDVTGRVAHRRAYAANEESLKSGEKT
jgi:hypothetical protein